MNFKRSYAIMMIAALCLVEFITCEQQPDDKKDKKTKVKKGESKPPIEGSENGTKTNCFLNGFVGIMSKPFKSKRSAPSAPKRSAPSAPSAPKLSPKSSESKRLASKLPFSKIVGKEDTNEKLTLLLVSGEFSEKQIVIVFIGESFPKNMVSRINKLARNHLDKTKFIAVYADQCQDYAKQYSIDATSKYPTYLFRLKSWNSKPGDDEQCRYVGTDNELRDSEILDRKLNELTPGGSQLEVASGETDIRNKLSNNKGKSVMLLFYGYSGESGNCCTEIISEFDSIAYGLYAFILVDIDLCPETAAEYGVDKDGLPALAVFKNVEENKEIDLVKKIDKDTMTDKVLELTNGAHDEYVWSEFEPVQAANGEEDVRNTLQSLDQNSLVVLYFDKICDSDVSNTVKLNLRQWAFTYKNLLCMQVDVGRCPRTAAEYGVDVNEEKLPVFVIFFNAKDKNKEIHVVNKYVRLEIEEKIKELLLSKSKKDGPKDIESTDVQPEASELKDVESTVVQPEASELKDVESTVVQPEASELKDVESPAMS